MGDDPSAEFAVVTIDYRARFHKLMKVPNPHGPHRLTDRTLFVTTPNGIIFTVDPAHAEAVADRLTRFLPAYAFGHVTSGDYYLVTPKYGETTRLIVLVTTGELLRLWAESYPAALARLANYGRGTTTRAVAA